MAATNWASIVKDKSTNKRNLVIFDSLNLAFRWKHRGTTEFAAEFLRTIASMADSYKGVDVVIAADKGQSSYRLEVSPDYKGDRKDKYKDQTEEEATQAKLFFEGFEKALDLVKLTYPLVRFKGVEADDIAAYLVSKLEAHYDNIWLISTDRDWDLLLSDKVHRFSYVSRKEFNLENYYEEHNCENPEEYISMKALMGDSGDSVAGIEGIGPKRAFNLIREHGSALDIYSSIPLAGKQKFIQKINESGDLICKNIELMDLQSFCAEAVAHPDPQNLVDLNNLIDKLIEELPAKLKASEPLSHTEGEQVDDI